MMSFNLRRIFMLSVVVGFVAASQRGFAADELESLRGDSVFATPGNGTRAYQRTARADFSLGNFQAEVTVTLKGGGGNGCAYFGLGKGVPDPASYNEPATAPSICLRLCPSDFVGGLVSAAANGKEITDGSSAIGDGMHRIRLTWDATTKRALFEISKNWDGKHFHADSVVTLDGAAIDFGSDARLFIGGANGDRFSGLSIKALTADDIINADFGENFHKDPSAGTWLPTGNVPSVSLSPDAAQLLKPIGGSLRLLSCWYSGPRLIASRAFTPNGVRTSASRWTNKVETKPVAGEKDVLDMTLTFTLSEGKANSAGVAAAFDFADWDAGNYVLIPASVYNGNRERIVGGGYANGMARTDLYKKDLPLSVRQLPHLDLEPNKPSKIEVLSCNATTPAICVYNHKTRRAFMVLAEQGLHIGGKMLDNGLAIEESPDRSHATLVVSAPGVREQKPEFIGFSGSPDRGVNLTSGDSLTLRLRVYSFEASDIPGVLDKFVTARKSVTGPNHPRNLYPMSEVTRLMTNRIDGRFINGKEFKFYGSVNADWECFGWVGGLMNTFPMVALGDGTHLHRVTDTFDFSIPAAQGKAGYFYEVRESNGKLRAQEAYGELPELSLTRRNGDMLFWMIKQFELLKAQNKAGAIKPEWEQGARRLADAFVATWKKDGEWGNYVNVNTGEVAVYNSTSGAMAVGGLSLAADYFNNPEYLQIAKQAADFYYDRDFAKLGMTTGACADILQNADSETAAGFMTSLMALYDTTGDRAWLDKSRALANLVSTWVVSYDYELPATTELGSLGAKLCGAVWASTQNKHGAPGFCTSSGDPLFKIYRATGDLRYAELMRDVIHAHAEGICGGGEITERLTYCDADSRGYRGGGSTGWNELNGILMAMELPGIYLQTDADKFFVFDHVEAELIKRDESGVTLKITNPTRFRANVAIFAESSEQAKTPLGYTAFLSWPKADVEAGDSAFLHVSREGKLQKVSAEKNSADTAPPRAVNLCQDWRFCRENPKSAPATTETVPAEAATSFNDSPWDLVSLPHTARIDSPGVNGAYFLGGCWYRHVIAVAPAWAGRRVSLEFDGAMQKADIWVNGVKAGTHLGGYLPFVVDLTPYIAGQDHVTAAVHLNNNASPEFPPGSNRIDFTYQGGLYRPVRLVVTDPVHITNAIEANRAAGGGVFVRCTSADAKTAVVLAQTDVRNHGSDPAATSVEHVLLAPDGSKVAEDNVPAKSLASGGEEQFASTFTVANPQLWHPDHPWLYTLISIVKKNGVICDQARTRCGLRWLAVTDDGFFLNGEKLVFRGANRHMSFPWLGNAGSDNMQYRDIRLLKEGGFNFVRLCHYPQSAATMDACDELGVMALVCTPGWQFFADNDSFKSYAKQNIRDSVRWHRNHPSAVLWEVSLNETYDHDTFYEECSSIAKAEYPGGQLLTSGDTYDAKRVRFYDIPYTGWGGSYSRPAHPDARYKKSLHREYGDNDVAWSVHVVGRGSESSMMVQAWNFQWTHNKNLSLPWTIGDSAWVGIDTPSAFGPSYCGPLDVYRLPKISYYFFQSQRDPAVKMANCDSGPMVHIAGDWTPRPSPTKVVVYSNADEVELFLNSKSVGKQQPDHGPDTGYGEYNSLADPMWVTKKDPVTDTQKADALAKEKAKSNAGKTFDAGNCLHLDHAPFTFVPVIYEPGELKAVAYIGGRVVATNILHTPGKALALRLRAPTLGKALSADGSDALFVYADILDAAGEVVPANGPAVSFHIEGAGRLVMPAESRAEAGISPMLVQASATPGVITVTATAPDLMPATLEIERSPTAGASAAEIRSDVKEPVDKPAVFQTKYAKISIDGTGFITSILSMKSGKEYCPNGHPSPLLSLHEDGQPNSKLLAPTSATFDVAKKEFELKFSNGSTAIVKAEARDAYFRLQLVSLTPRGNVDNIVWGPLHTTISKIVGDIIGVARDDDWAIGMVGLDDNTITGPVEDGDCYGMGYSIHSPDPAKFPVPPKYKEGDHFYVGGDGVSDTAFFSHPEEYFRYVMGSGAIVEPEFGSTVAYHARDRRKSYTHLFSLLPGFARSRPRHQVSDPLPGVDFIGSGIALYACPDDQGLATIEKITLAEGLPHIMIGGKWIRDPSSFSPTVYWNGPVDKAIEYTKALGFKDISRDTGEFYANRSGKWEGRVGFSDGKSMSYKQFAEEAHKQGLTHGGLHTLCLFAQGGINNDVTPIPNEHLQTVCRTKLAKDISATDTEIVVTDPSFLAEKGTWTWGDESNYLQIGGEMLRYDSISTTAPWSIKVIKRGHASKAAAHKAGDELVKLQQNCYNGFVPDMTLMLDYADYYADLMVRNRMDTINFDGFESTLYQNQGYYGVRVFCRRLFETYAKLSGGGTPRVTGSCVFAGSWEYMNVCDCGGGNNMFNVITGRRATEGKDIGNGFSASYFPATFGIQGFNSAWSLYDAENLQAKAVGWDATYALSVSQAALDKCADRDAIFKAFRAWQNARAAGVFTKEQELKLRDPDLRFHLEQTGEKSFVLYPLRKIEGSWTLGKPDVVGA